jgi:hypothetical protein
VQYTNKADDVLVITSSGGLGATPYRDRDISNYRSKIKRETNQNDMMQALTHFTQKKEKDPGFYYKFLVDSDNKVK